MILNGLKTQRKSITTMQRAGQACSPTKSEWDSANAKPYKHTDDCSMKSDWDSAENLIDGADGEQSLSLATDRVERILTLIKSQNVAIYNKK